MTTSEKIKSRRKQLNLTLEQIADFVGVVPSTILKWERGDTDSIKIAYIEKLAIILKVKPEYLIFDNYNIDGTINCTDDFQVQDMSEVQKEIYRMIPLLNIRQQIELCNYLYDKLDGIK